MEGNTTLYALPKAEIVARWHDQTHDDFRFCFKFPATISHQAALRNCEDLTQEFFTRLSPLEHRLGQYWLQLPATFGPQALPALWDFLDGLPKAFTYGVEVRHAEFFAKGEAETQLNRGLHMRGVNRVILSYPPYDTLSNSVTLRCGNYAKGDFLHTVFNKKPDHWRLNQATKQADQQVVRGQSALSS